MDHVFRWFHVLCRHTEKWAAVALQPHLGVTTRATGKEILPGLFTMPASRDAEVWNSTEAEGMANGPPGCHGLGMNENEKSVTSCSEEKTLEWAF